MASLYSYLYGCDFNAFGLPKLIGEMAPDAMTAWEAYCFRQENGRWPTMKELESVEYDNWKSEHAWMEERYIDEINRQYEDTQSNGSLVVSDADYIALSYSVGTTDGRLDVIPFGTEGIYGQPYRSAYLMVHAADRAPPKNTCGLSSGTRWSRATRCSVRMPATCPRALLPPVFR